MQSFASECDETEDMNKDILSVTIDLERISIGGSVFWNNRDWFLPHLPSCIQGKLVALSDGCELVPACLRERAGDFGALALVV